MAGRLAVVDLTRDRRLIPGPSGRCSAMRGRMCHSEVSVILTPLQLLLVIRRTSRRRPLLLPKLQLLHL